MRDVPLKYVRFPAVARDLNCPALCHLVIVCRSTPRSAAAWETVYLPVGLMFGNSVIMATLFLSPSFPKHPC